MDSLYTVTLTGGGPWAAPWGWRRIMGGAVAAVPFYGMMMVLLLVAFGVQSSAPE